jgi:hypothetical protein
MMLDENGEYDGKKWEGTTDARIFKASWFTEDNAEYVGNREDIVQSIEQLTGMWKTVKPYIQDFMDGFTGREHIVVHYGDEVSGQVYCCDRQFKFYKGHAFTHDPQRVTCPEYSAVVHYAEPRDNAPRCCGATYPLEVNHTWTAELENVTCTGEALEHFWCDSTENHIPHIYRLQGHLIKNPRVVRCDGWPNPHNQESEPEPPSKPCGSTKGHASHIWQEWEDSQEGPLWSCTGLTFPDLSPVDSSGETDS